MAERRQALGIESRSALFRRTALYGEGVPIAQTTLKRWETEFDIKPETESLMKLAYALADSNSERDRADMVERVFAAAGQVPPDGEEIRISVRVRRRLGPKERRAVIEFAETLASLKSHNMRMGRELARGDVPADDETADDEEDDLRGDAPVGAAAR